MSAYSILQVAAWHITTGYSAACSSSRFPSRLPAMRRRAPRGLVCAGRRISERGRRGRPRLRGGRRARRRSATAPEPRTPLRPPERGGDRELYLRALKPRLKLKASPQHAASIITTTTRRPRMVSRRSMCLHVCCVKRWMIHSSTECATSWSQVHFATIPNTSQSKCSP